MDISLVTDVIEDPELSQLVTHLPLTNVQSRDGNAIPTFGDSQEIRVLIRPASTFEFAIKEGGQADAATLAMFVRSSYGVSNDDRVRFRGTEWRTTERQTGYASDPEFDVFTLVEDSRSRTSDSTSDDTSSDNSDNYDVVG